MAVGAGGVFGAIGGGFGVGGGEGGAAAVAVAEGIEQFEVVAFDFVFGGEFRHGGLRSWG